MIIYRIDIPVITKNLNKTYFKKMEIVEFEFDSTTECAISIVTHEYKSNKWQHTYKDGPITIKLEADEILDSPITEPEVFSGSVQNRQYLIFSNLNHAKMSKIRFIEKLPTDLEDKITKLRLKVLKNIPKTHKMIKELQDSYPEDFV